MKTFTAAAIFKLEEEGVLALSDPPKSVFPDVPENGTRIIVATNTFELFDTESFATDLVSFLLEAP